VAEEKIKTLLHEKELLLREVHHRIKNNMLTITSLLFLQTESLKDPAAISALNDAISRIQSMVLLYDKLYRSSDFNELSVLDYLSPLVDEIINNFPNYHIVTIEKVIENFLLPTSMLFPIGIMINELLTNAMKYAFVGRNKGLLTVSAAKVENRISFSIKDDGVGITDTEETSNGFGLQLVNMLVKQIRGKVSIKNENGTTFTLTFEMK
jgi:two-component sensor histidine kinase